jgi:Mandelate racemase / muconate lactonizing enzyme, N-terminal domain
MAGPAKRRTMVSDNCGCSLAPQAAPLGADAIADVHSGLKITGMKVFGVSLTPNSDRPNVFVRLETSQGLVGWGEGTLEGKAGAVMACINDFRDFLIGADPMQVEHIWQSMYVHSFYRAGPVIGSAISGIDQALWDIRGKAPGMPVYKLPGGPFDPRGVRGYYHVDGANRDQLLQIRETALAQGLSCFKSGIPGYYEWIERRPKIEAAIKAIQMQRDALGPDIDSAVDFHAKTGPSVASTLNLGLRNEMVTPWSERHNRLAVFVPAHGGKLVPVATPVHPGNTVTDGRYTNLAPRIGFAFSVNHKTVIRAGFGIFYAYETYNSNPQARNAPFNGSVITTNSTGTAGYASALPLSAGFPADRPTLFPAAGTAFQVFQRNYPNPSANEWNFNIQRQLTSHDALSVAYVGQNGVHILINPNINQALPGPGAVAARRPYPNLADGTLNCTCANSSFNSFQVTYKSRLAAGLDFQGAYTYSHSLDDSCGNSNAVGLQNPSDFTLYRGNSDCDVRHLLVLSWSCDLPFVRGKRFAGGAHGLIETAIGGWRLNSIETFSTGAPFTPVMVSSLLNSGNAAQWPNLIGSGKIADPSIHAWFNTADFVSPGNYTYGNSGRNILFGPGTKQVDLSLFKDFPFNESATHRLQFRAEAFNLLNTPQFNNPNAQIGNPAAGTIVSAGAPLLYQRTSRQMQLALKLYW